jgi:hypothetical protein
MPEYNQEDPRTYNEGEDVYAGTEVPEIAEWTIAGVCAENPDGCRIPTRSLTRLI